MEGEAAGAAVMVEVGGTPARWGRKQDVGWGKMAAFDVVTGAFGFTGKHIARLLLAMGRTVVTLTAHPERPHPFGDRVKALPLDFEDPRAMSEAMRGADTLYNTYWIRFERGLVTFERAVRNSEKLVAAAPEVYSFGQLVQLIAREIRSRARIVHLAPAMAYLLGRVVGSLVGDVIITEDEIAGLMANLLVSSGAPTGKVRFSEWLSRNAHLVGVRYASELQRHYR